MRSFSWNQYIVLLVWCWLTCALHGTRDPFHLNLPAKGTEISAVSPIEHSYYAGTVSALTCQTPTTQVDALRHLYYNTSGPQWQFNSNYTKYGIPWNFTQPQPNPCVENWQYISCTSYCYVQVVNMVSVGLSGSLPSDILLNLPYLSTLSIYNNPQLRGRIPTPYGNYLLLLNLQYNQLSGTIPEDMGVLSSVRNIYFTYNRLTGTIPESLGNCRTLVYLDLSYNFLHGTIPSSFGQLSKIYVMNLGGNAFNGSIPSSLTTWNRTVNYFFLNNNQFSGTIPSFIFTWPKLTYFYLYENNFQGSLPANIGNTTSMVYLYFDNNQLTGTIPSSICQWKHINVIDFTVNFLTGSIPSCLGELVSLQYLYLYSNNLNGTLPANIGNLRGLIESHLQYNQLSGTLPASIANLASLQNFYVQNNHFNGRIPGGFWQLKQLKKLYLYNNQFSGSISDSIGNMSQLLYFSAFSNRFSGSIPSGLGHCTSLQIIALYNNRFTGSLPPALSNLRQMTQLAVSINHLDGSIAIDFSKMNYLDYLSLDSNLLTGSIPSSVMNIESAGYVYLDRNELTGSLPAITASLQVIELISVASNYLTGTISNNFTTFDTTYCWYFFENYFTGTIPTQMGDLYQMEFFMLYNNLLSGSLPTSIANLESMNYLSVNSNFLTGTIAPAMFSNMPSLLFLGLSSNQFSGTFPPSLSLISVEVMDISYNRFSGSFGTCLQGLQSLQRLSMESNRFTGRLDILLDPLAQPYLQLLDLSDNSFSGSLAPYFFQFQQLGVLILAKNCITGSIPSNICNGSRELNTLVIDGLFSSPSCTKRIFEGIPGSKPYMLTNKLSGSIPACLFSAYPNLTTLHLSGNAIAGSIPDTITAISPQLSDLSLSYNQLTGTIPAIIQRHGWDNLDLSFNKLTGELDAGINGYVTNATFTLKINHLSGTIPPSLKDVDDIDILIGNIFTCEEDGSDLPTHDKYRDSYSCGSNTVNIALYSWLAITCTVFLALLAMSFIARRFTSEQQQPYPVVIWCKEMYTYTLHVYWMSLNQIETKHAALHTLLEFSVMLREFRRWSAAVTVYILVISVPLYPALTLYYGSYTHEYAWTLSLSYKSGLVPATVCFFFLLFMLCCVFLDVLSNLRINVNHLQRQLQSTSVTEGRTESTTSSTWSKTSSGQSKMNEDVVSSNDNDTAKETVPLNNAQSIFNSAYWWYFYVSILLLINVSVVLSVNMGFVSATNTSMSASAKQSLAFLVSIFKIAWNSLMFRLFSILLDSSRPSTSLGEKKMSLEVFGIYMTWLSIFNSIIAPCISIAFISPDCFQYAFVQAPSVDSDYSIESCTLSFNNGAGSTINCNNGTTFLYQVSYDPPFVYSFQCSSTLLSSFSDVFIFRYLIGGIIAPLLVMALKVVQELAAKRFGGQHVAVSLSTAALPPALQILSSLSNLPSLNEMVDAYPYRLMKIEKNMVSLITDASIMLTLGTIFPPIAVVGCVSIIFHTVFFQLSIGRLVQLSIEHTEMAKFTRKVMEECYGVSELLIKAVASMSLLVSVMWSFFLFDTLGDEVGFVKALWIIILMGMWSYVIVAINYWTRNSKKAEVQEGVELPEVSDRMKSRAAEGVLESVENPMNT